MYRRAIFSIASIAALGFASLPISTFVATPADAQQARPAARDHRKASQPSPVVRDHRKSAPGIVSATGSGVKQAAKKRAGEATAPVRGAVNTTAKSASGARDLVTGRPVRGAKKIAGAAAGAAVAPVRTVVNAGSKVATGAKKVGRAAKSVAKKLNPFD